MRSTIIILAYGKAERTIECLDTLLDNIQVETDEVIVLDNGSPMLEQNKLEAFSADCDLNFIASSENLGFAAGCNAAAKHAKSEKLVFLNNDVQVQPDWLEPLLESLDDDSTGISGLPMIFPDGTVQQAGISFARWGLPVNRGVGCPWPASNAESQQLFGISGSCIAIKKDLFETLNGFDEQFFFSYEDIDLCLRARKSGKKAVLVKDIPLTHIEGASHIADVTDKYRWLAEQKFAEKWNDQIEENLVREYDLLTKEIQGDLYVFGSGRAGMSMVTRLQQLSSLTVKGFVDDENSFSNKETTLPLYHIHDLQQENTSILVASMFADQIAERIKPKTKSRIINGARLLTNWQF